MSYAESGDEQSEDGELRHSPETRQKNNPMDFRLVSKRFLLFDLSIVSWPFSLSEDEAENVDSLDIKPPQARIAAQSSKSRRREGHDSRSHHKRSERYRDERGHSHREKHHRYCFCLMYCKYRNSYENPAFYSRDKHLHMQKDREHYQREKDRYYREKQAYDAAMYKESYVEVRHMERRERKEARYIDQRKYDEKKVKDGRDIRYKSRDAEKHRRERYEDEKREKADKTLQDLRERLLSKRTYKSDEENYKQERSGSRKDKRQKESESVDSALQGAAGAYVKEIINISTGEERRYKKEDKHREDDKLTEEERVEQELRREKLLEAGKLFFFYCLFI